MDKYISENTLIPFLDLVLEMFKVSKHIHIILQTTTYKVLKLHMKQLVS